MNDTVKLLDRVKAAEYLNVSPYTLESWITKKDFNDLPIIKMGRSVRYKQSDLDAFIEKKRKILND